MMLTFLGATGTITGSTYAVTRGDACLLVDGGLLHGCEQIRVAQWGPFSVAPTTCRIGDGQVPQSGVPLVVAPSRAEAEGIPK